MPEKFNLIAVGRAYTDIVAPASLVFLKKYGIPLDGQTESSIEELQQIQCELKSPILFAGGASANTVSVVSALGGSAGYFGKVCHDEAGENFLQDLVLRNIALCCDPYAELETLSGTCLVLLTDEHRSFAYNPGCSNQFTVADFDHFNFAKTDFILIEGHLLTHADSVSAMEYVLKNAKPQCKIVINLQGIVAWNQHDKKVAELIASTADIIMGNQMEQQVFEPYLTPYSASQVLVTTLGKAGATARQGALVWNIPAVTPEKMINTLGAGDAFIAGFLLGLSKYKSISESLDLASHAAAAIISEVGGRPALGELTLKPKKDS
jgi:sugar/nucleoside kinase (ribokinase family)